MSLTDVKCKVESCYYWGDGNICKADSIMVDNNLGQRAGIGTGNLGVGTTGTTAGRTGRTEAGDLTVGSENKGRTRDFEAGDLTTGAFRDAQTEGRTKTSANRSDVLAKTSHETLCSTFRPKNTEPKH